MTETKIQPLLSRDPDAGWFYTGDLRAAKRVVLSDRHPMMGIDDNFKTGVQTYVVELREGNAHGAVAECGSSTESFDEAWRFALGEFFSAGGSTWPETSDRSLREQVAAHASPFM